MQQLVKVVDATSERMGVSWVGLQRHYVPALDFLLLLYECTDAGDSLAAPLLASTFIR